MHRSQRSAASGAIVDAPMSSDGAPNLRELFARLDGVLLCDRRTLRARLGGLEKAIRQGKSLDPRAVAQVTDAIEHSLAARAARQSRVPSITYPQELPFASAVPTLRDALLSSQVVVVAGETGSGKSTQLPKLCLEIGRGIEGRIAHTQPRRIAARSVARRIADELGVRLGGVVGVKVRFGDETGPDTMVKVLTDGMLLAETRADPRLDAYDTVIVDEAHERSLNIDFLLGYLRKLVVRRPDLKVILTSATIDVERLSAHFGQCPVVEIPGRSYQIEQWYRPAETVGLDEEDPRFLENLARSIDEVDRAFVERGAANAPDILVFLSGEREIREAESHLTGHFRGHVSVASSRTEILPLFARQPLEEQERIFSPGPKRRIVLATNVAETSLTVPRIHAVVDAGFARILRYSARSRVQRLPIEPISQASARQRAGRAGRVCAGIAVRLYSEEDFQARGAYTQPEILRTNLASVILQMEALRLGKAEDFPFVDPPGARQLADARATLVELGASTAEGRLTKIGESMSHFPLDPRLSRMLLASIDEHCTNDVLVVAAGLAVQDPRIRVHEHRDAADLAHLRFQHPASDFLSFLRMWRVFRRETADLGSSARRKWCERHFLSHQRLREWVDTVAQLREIFREHFGIKVGEVSESGDEAGGDDAGASGRFHRAVLAGFLSHVGARTEKGEYRGPTGALFQIHPSSGLVRRAPQWLVAAELVETTRRYARICARIQPEWVARVAPHMVTRTQFDPAFVPETGQVSGWERSSYGELVVVAKRRIPWTPVDAASARAIFIQEGLVGHAARTDGEFLARNRRLREALEEEEARGRRRGQLLEEDAAFAFYDRRVPEDVRSTPAFERWRRDAEQRDPAVLLMREDDLLRDDAPRAEERLYPRSIALEALDVPLVYTHDPESEKDGVTARIPVEALGLVDPQPFEWLVEGRLLEKVEALIRSLPKHLRVRLFPMDEVAQGAVEALEFGRGALLSKLARHLSTVAGTRVEPSDFRVETLPNDLRMRFEVVDAHGAVLGEGRDLPQLTARFATISRERLGQSIDRSRDPVTLLERAHVRVMPDEPVPEQIRYVRAGITLVGYPALVLERVATTQFVSIALRVLDTRGKALREHAAAVGELAARELRDAVAHHFGYHPLCESLTLLAERAGLEVALDTAGTPSEDDASCRNDLVHAIARMVAMQACGDLDRVPREPTAFHALVRGLEPRLADLVGHVVRALHAILVGAEEIIAFTAGAKPNAAGTPKERILARLGEILTGRSEIGGLEGVLRSDRDALSQCMRLVEMLRERLERLRAAGGSRDAQIDAELDPLRDRVRAALASPTRPWREALAIQRLLDEIEISRFAPKMPRAFPASEKRLAALLQDGSER